tara:strand:+ start:2599 stop:3198 length:600 start_codon:yes stop_codon:yes gene_type:complete
MRKFFYFLLLLPVLGLLAHDVYLFTQNQEKGFMLSDAGWIWSKYHPETHDEWKIKLKEYEDTVKDSIPLEDIAKMIPVVQPEEPDEAASPDSAMGEELEAVEPAPYEEEFTQKDGKDGSEVIPPKVQEKKKAEERAILQSHIGFLLEQKAVIIAFAIVVAIYIIDLFFSLLFGLIFGRGSKSKKSKKGSRHKHGKRMNY